MAHKKFAPAVALANRRTKKLSKKRRHDIALHAIQTRWRRVRERAETAPPDGDAKNPSKTLGYIVHQD